jgi:hypothetical protein
MPNTLYQSLIIFGADPQVPHIYFLNLPKSPPVMPPRSNHLLEWSKPQKYT